MKRFQMFRSESALALVLLLALGGFGCGDDDPVKPEDEFQVTLAVVDTAGNPVPDLQVSMFNVFPGCYCKDSTDPFLAFDGADKARVTFLWEAAQAAQVRLTIRDIEGQVVRDLYDGCVLQAGLYSAVWVGDDNDGSRLPSGRYTLEMVATDTTSGNTVFQDTHDMYMALGTSYTHGPTSEYGRIVFSDKKLFPQLYDREVMPLYDADGTVLGSWKPGAEMFFRAYDPINNIAQGYHADVVKSGDVVQLVWDPDKSSVSYDSASADPASAAVLRQNVQGKGTEYTWQLQYPYPNPFN